MNNWIRVALIGWVLTILSGSVWLAVITLVTGGVGVALEINRLIDIH